MSLGYTLDHAVTPVPVKGDQRDLISRYGEQPVQQAQAAWACLLDATAGAAFEGRVLSAVMVRDAWCQILNWTGPSSEAETLLLERQLETVRNYGDEDPKRFFSRVDQFLTRLRSINVHKTQKKIVNILVRNLSDYYKIEKRSRLDSPFLRRRDVEHIVRASCATRKMRQLEQRSASGVTPNPHALVASGGFQTTRGGCGGPRRGGGRSSGGRRGIRQSWSRGGGNHHFNRQQQEQQPRPPPKPVTANFGLGGAFDGGTNAGGWPQEESPLSPNGLAPHSERCGRKGHVAGICRAPSRFEGICGTCGQYGHWMRYCIRNQSSPHAHVPAAPVPSPVPSAPAFSAPPTGGSGYSITTGAYGYGGDDGPYSGDPHDHDGHGDDNYEAVPVGQSPGGGGAGHDIPPRPPGAPDGGYHRAMQQAGNGGDGVVFAAEDGGHEDEGYFGGPFPPFSVARNRVMAPLLMYYSFQPAVAAAAPAVISRCPRRSTAVVTTATVPIGVRSSSTAAVVVVIVRNRSCDTTAAATVQHCGRSTSTAPAPAPSVALAGSRGVLAAMDRRLMGWRIVLRRGKRSGMLRWTAMVGLFLRGLDPRRQPHRWQDGGPLYRHTTSDGCNHLAGPSHRQPPLSRTRPLRSGSNRTRWRCRCSPCRRGSGSSH